MWGRRSPQRDGDCGVGSPAQGPAVLGGDGHQDARSGSGRSLAHSPAGGPVPLGFRHRLSRRHRSGEEAYRRAGTQLRPLRPPGAGAEAEGGPTRSSPRPGPATAPSAPLRGGASAPGPAPPVMGFPGDTSWAWGPSSLPIPTRVVPGPYPGLHELLTSPRASFLGLSRKPPPATFSSPRSTHKASKSWLFPTPILKV